MESKPGDHHFWAHGNPMA